MQTQILPEVPNLRGDNVTSDGWHGLLVKPWASHGLQATHATQPDFRGDGALSLFRRANRPPYISYSLTTFPVFADFSAARQASTAARDSSGVMTVGFRPSRTQRAK